MKKIKKNLINFGVGGSLLLANTLYSSLSFAYRLDKDIELSSVNYSFMSDVIFDMLLPDEAPLQYQINLNQEINNNLQILENNKNSVAVLNRFENACLENCRIIKKGSSDSIYKSGVLGINSAILSEANLKIKKSYIKTFGNGAKGVYQNKPDSRCLIQNTIVETLQDNSNAVEVANGSFMKIKNSLFYTSGENSGGICVSATSKLLGEKLSLYIENDYSPALYLNGSMVIKNSLIETEKSYLGLMEGKSNMILFNNSLRGFKGFKLLNKSEDQDYFNVLGISKGYINVENDPVFDIDNVSAKITLSHLNVNSVDNKFLHIKSNNQNKNIDLILDNVKSNGSIETDQLSSVNVFINNNCNILGSFSGNIKINFLIDDFGEITLTKDSMIDEISLPKNDIRNLKKVINFNGFTLSYNKNNNEWLHGRNYYFEDGGALLAI